MSNRHIVDVDTDSGSDPKVDLNTLHMIFGKPGLDVAEVQNHGRETPITNEHVRDNHEMMQLAPVPAASYDRDNSSAPSLEDNLQPKDNQHGDIAVPGGAGKEKHEETQNDDFNWWSSTGEADQPGEEDGIKLESRFGEPDPPPPPAQAPPDVNAYQQRKNLAHGMMDLALLSANANQLRYVIESPSHPYYYPSVTFVSLSIVLQITVGILLILNSRYDVTKIKQIRTAIRVNDVTVVGVFLITIINVFLTSFSGASPSGGTGDAAAQRAP